MQVMEHQSSKQRNRASSGENIQLTIDWDIQSQLTQMVEQCLYNHTAERYQQTYLLYSDGT